MVEKTLFKMFDKDGNVVSNLVEDIQSKKMEKETVKFLLWNHRDVAKVKISRILLSDDDEDDS